MWECVCYWLAIVTVCNQLDIKLLSSVFILLYFDSCSEEKAGIRDLPCSCMYLAASACSTCQRVLLFA